MRALIRFVRRRIALKLALTLVGFVAVSSLAAGMYLNRALEAFAVESLETRLTSVGGLLLGDAGSVFRDGAPPERAQAFVARVAQPIGARVTLIAPDGRVVGESERSAEELEGLENHRDRPEVQAALAGRRGRAVRHSTTIHAPLLYVAMPVRDSARVIGVLRLALPLSAVTASYATVHQVMLAGGAVALIVALGIALFVAGRLTRPLVEMQTVARLMSQGNFLVRAPRRSTDELGMLGRSLNVMAMRLREKIDDLEHERAKLVAVVDGLVEGVVAVDGQERVLLMNERARAIFRLGPARGEGKPFLEVIRNAELHEVFRASRDGVPGAVARREIHLSAPAGRVLQVSGVPLALAGGDTGVVIVLHDITELRRLEQVRTEFVANVSHELRTPLTAIHGYVETLLAGALEETDNARNFLGVVHRQTERLGRLINDLTDLSNLELGRVSFYLAPTSLGEVVDGVLAVMQPRARGGDITVNVDLAPALPAIQADHDRLAQILINLVDNAVKYTPPRGTITISAVERKPGVVEILVADTGAGIPAADLPRITERFYRVDKARSRELGGTGLGLAIVKHLVQAHGGTLTIESEVGRGTSVRFTLPAVHDGGEPA